MTDKMALEITKTLGRCRYKVAEKFGVTSRQQITKILKGDSNNPELFEALVNEYNRIKELKKSIA